MMARPEWETISEFRNGADYDAFVSWLAGEVVSGAAERVQVGKRFAGSNLLSEHWYRHVASGEIWRLVAPDPPFAGIFERVERAE